MATVSEAHHEPLPAVVRRWLVERVATTPGRLVLVAILVVAGAACFGAIATFAERSRAQAAQAARSQTEPVLIRATALNTALSAAAATATATFLSGGLEPQTRRAAYLADLGVASGALAALARAAGSSAQARAAVATIVNQLPLYTGLVESARANNRQNFPVGAAYLREASSLLTRPGGILPAADRLYAAEAQRLSDDYGTGMATTALIVLVVAVVLAAALLVWAQHYLTGISHRVVNIPMAVATAVLVAGSTWAIIGLLSEQSALASARRASDSVEVLSATRVLLSRAQSDESLTLVNRGSDETDPRDFAAVMQTLGSRGGLLSEVSVLARRDGTAQAAHQLTAAFAAYRSETANLTQLESTGQITQAIPLASSHAATSIADRLNTNLAGQISAAQRRFTQAAADATASLSGLAVAIPALTILTAALALVGLRERLREYR